MAMLPATKLSLKPVKGRRLVLVMHMRELDMRLRVKAESRQVVIVPPGEWKLLLPVLFLLLFLIIMGCHLVATKAEEHLILVVSAEVVGSVQRKVIILWILRWRRYGILKSNICFVFL